MKGLVRLTMFGMGMSASVALSSPGHALPEHWCAITQKVPAASVANAARAMVATSPRVDFRGAYEEFDLAVVDGTYAGISSDVRFTCFEKYAHGDDGLWVVEAATRQKAEWLAAGVQAAGLKIMFRSDTGLSFVATGAEKLPNVEGLDGCGENPDVSVIPVPQHAVPLDILRVGPSFHTTCCGTSGRFKKPAVQAVVDSVSQRELKASVQALQDFGTRNSYSKHVHAAARYLAGRAGELGLSTSEFLFREDMGPNVIAEKKGRSEEFVIVGAHFDSRSTDSSSPTQDAPGADDNASGSSAVLEAMRLLAGLKTEKSIRFIWFCGEEQGLIGSRAIAAAYKAGGEPLYAMVNADMLGYTLPGGPIQLGFKDRSVSMKLTEFAMNATDTYVGIPSGFSSSCCSDYLGFYEEGFPSVGFFENNATASAYPAYHKSDDLVQYVNLEQLALETKAIVATVAELVGVHN